jgi:DNA-binding MarR family transcriptional regulator
MPVQAPPTTPLHDGELKRAWLSVARTYELCSDTVSLEIKPLGLKLQQFEILLALLPGPQTQADLVMRSFVVKSHMSALLTQMQTEGWVERLPSQADKRSKMVTLTEAGLVLASQCQAVQRNVMATMFAPLTDVQVLQTEQVMLRVEAALRTRAAAAVLGAPA